MADSKFIQLFIKLFDNRTLALQFPTHQTLTAQSIKHQIETLTQIPTQSQKLTLNGKFLDNSIPISTQSLSFSTLYLNFSLLGGKGGFGSLLRGAATKAGQKKTNNFDACRDMSGRRLRHVNAEKKLEDWKAEEEERKLEKVAEDYLKKMANKGRGGKKEEGAEKYVAKYREESARCVEEVERSVRESVADLLVGGKKRKFLEKLKGKGESEGLNPKKLKIWMGKRKLGESDSDDSDDDEKSDESDVENEKSSVINNENQSDTSKDGSFGSASVPESDVDYQVEGPSDSGSEEEKETVTGGSSGSGGTPMNGSGLMDTSSDASDAERKTDQTRKMSVSAEMVSTSTGAVIEQTPGEPDPQGIVVADQVPSTSNLKELDVSQLATTAPEGQRALASQSKSASPDEGVIGSLNVSDELQPLNFDDFNSAAELEALGLERLKSELQARGLKCGGTREERAARLFLLKTTPVEKLPKKLLAKK